MNDENNTTDDLYQAYADATESGDNAKRSVISQLIKAEEQGLAGSEASNISAVEGRGIEGSDAAREYIKDFGKSLTQLGVMETVGTANRLLPTTGLGTADEDYYGLLDAPASVFGHAIKSKLGFDTNQEELGGITIPLEQYTSNPRFEGHMRELEKYAHLNAAKQISPELAKILEITQSVPHDDPKFADYNNLYYQTFETLRNEAQMTDNKDLALKLQNFEDGTWRMASMDESGENVIINRLPEIDAGMFGFDMTLDPYFSKKGDLVLPGEGVFGMRDGKLDQLASAIGRPLDEMFMEGSPGAEWASENITDKLAFQGPEMLQPKDTGMGYSHGMLAGLLRGIGWPAAKGIFKAGKAGYNLAKGSPAKNVQKIEPYLYEGILQNIK